MYPLHKFLWELRRDPGLAGRFRADPSAVIDPYGMDPADRDAVMAGDFRALLRRGANPYLVYFCALQIGVSRDTYYAQIRGEPVPGEAGRQQGQHGEDEG